MVSEPKRELRPTHAGGPSEPARPELSVVVPLFNEEAVVDALHRRLTAAVSPVVGSYELLFVDDGSRDGTVTALAALCAKDANLTVIRLSRNFGHQAALLAGLDHARGSAVVMMDGDLQHPPELVPELIGRWREGYDIVYTVRQHDETSNLWKRSTRRAFYALFRWVSQVSLEAGAADFRLLDARVVEALRRFHERFVFFRGLIGWMGFRTSSIPYATEPRHAGSSKYTLRRMVRLALNGLFSFSVLPLRIAIWSGLAVAASGIAYAVFVLYAALVLHSTVAGWTSLMVVVLILGGMQLTMLGIVGEYVGRVYEEAKGRPIYLVQEIWGREQRDAPGAQQRHTPATHQRDAATAR